jgi:O-antigen/teichoic acid export membrane protein
MFLITPLGGLLISISKEKNMNIFYGISVLINVILNFILIPYYSYIGAASATIISEITLVMFYIIFISNQFYKLPIREIMMGPIIASLVMALFINICNRYNFYIVSFLAMIVYILTLYGLKYLSEEEIDMLKKLSQKL